MPSWFRNFNAHRIPLFTWLFALCGIAVALMAGAYHLEYERSVQRNEWRHEVDSSIDGIEKNIMRAEEVAKLFRVSLSQGLPQLPQSGALPSYSHLPTSTTPEPSSLQHAPSGYQDSYEKKLLNAYTEIAPQSYLPGFKALVFVEKPEDGVGRTLPAPLKSVFIKEGFPVRDISEKLTMSFTSPTVKPPVWHFVKSDMMALSVPVGDKRSFVSLIISPYIFFNKSLPQNRVQPFSLTVYGSLEGDDVVYRTADFQAVEKGATAQRTLNLYGSVWRLEFQQTKSYAYSPWPFVTVFLISLVSVLLSMFLSRTLLARNRAESEAKSLAQKFTSADNKFKHLNEEIPSVIILFDENNNVSDINKEARSLLDNGSGFLRLALIMENPDVIKAFSHLEKSRKAHLEKLRLNFGDRDVWLNVALSRREISGKPYTLFLGHDITELIKLSNQLEAQGQKLHYLALHDPLTGLFNRRAFEDKTDEYIGLLKKDEFSVLYIDLDQFKIVNDTAGHLAGDRLLIVLSGKLRESIGDVFFARLGGDEFGILVKGGVSRAKSVAGKILSIAESFDFSWEGQSYQVTASIGLVHSSVVRRAVGIRPMSREDMLSRADAACYMSKQQGRNRLHEFTPDGESFLHQQEMEWTLKIQNAISENRLIMYRQKIVSLLNHSARDKYELLVRMKDTDGNIITAGDFIPAAERFGLMPIFDRWVFTHALENFRTLSPSGETYAINVSGQTIDDPGFEDFLIDLIKKHKVPPSRLCIEITETTAIKNISRMEDILPRVRQLGCMLALDDFGVGMSSFSYLKKFKADYIKIDGSFIRDLDQNPISMSIVSAIVDMSRQMGIAIVAECVGSQAILDVLREKGVQYGQGFFLGLPEPASL